jgi:protein phosphatase
MTGQFLKILDVATLTDVGLKRQRNEDSNRLLIPPDSSNAMGALFMVADGMGGLGGGDVASQTAIESIFQRYFAPNNTEDNLEKRLHDALETANASVRDQAPKLRLMRIGSTAAGMILTGMGDVLVFNVGDCRVYRIREDKIERLSHDQSVLESRIDHGMSPEEAARTTNTSMVTAFLGQPFPIKPEFRGDQAQDSDVYLICSDGLWGLTKPDEMLSLVKNTPAQTAAKKLIELALKRGGSDNITVMVVRVGKAPGGSKLLLPAAIAAAVIAVIAIAAIVIGSSSAKPSPTPQPSPIVTTAPADNATAAATRSQ